MMFRNFHCPETDVIDRRTFIESCGCDGTRPIVIHTDEAYTGSGLPLKIV